MSKQFLQLFSDPAPALRVKFRPSDRNAETIDVQHKLGLIPGAASLDYLSSLGKYAGLGEFRDFYMKHDGAELCRTHDALPGQGRQLLELKPASSIVAFTSMYQPGGRWDWTIDLNKSKALYRGSASWIAFAEINRGPACLTIFLEGENAGCVYFLTPQPPFNILRPIARGFRPLLERVGKDLPAFLRLVRATVRLRGTDGENYGFSPVDYISNLNEAAGEISAPRRGEITPPR